MKLAKSNNFKPAEVRRLLTFLNQEGPIENNELLRRMGLAQSVLRDLKREVSQFLEPPSAKTALNSKGKRLAKKIATPPPDWQSIAKTLIKYQPHRPQPKRQWDQFLATPETVLERVQLMSEQGDLEGRDVLFLGDDDLSSVATALSGLTRITQVVDIDQEVLDLINTIARKEKLKINSLKYNARKFLLPHLQNRFDTVFTDPPYTPAGVKLFLSRAIDSLRLQPISALYFCYGTSRRSLERELKIQALLVQAGLVLKLKLPNFNHYHGVQSIGSTSDLYLATPTPQTKPLITGPFSGNIYTHQSP